MGGSHGLRESIPPSFENHHELHRIATELVWRRCLAQSIRSPQLNLSLIDLFHISQTLYFSSNLGSGVNTSYLQSPDLRFSELYLPFRPALF